MRNLRALRGCHLHAVRYEAMITSPEDTWEGVFRYLGLPFDDAVLSHFGDVELAGRWGGQPGTRRYDGVSREPLESWKQVLNKPVRKAWCRRYLGWIGRERLAMMGYDYDVLTDELDAIPPMYLAVSIRCGPRLLGPTSRYLRTPHPGT